jgi:hypothetical protein
LPLRCDINPERACRRLHSSWGKNGVGTLSFENAIIAIASLIMLSTVSGLLFAVLVQPRRDKTNLLFSLFCLSLLLWSLVAGG